MLILILVPLRYKLAVLSHWIATKKGNPRDQLLSQAAHLQCQAGGWDAGLDDGALPVFDVQPGLGVWDGHLTPRRIQPRGASQAWGAECVCVGRQRGGREGGGGGRKGSCGEGEREAVGREQEGAGVRGGCVEAGSRGG